MSSTQGPGPMPGADQDMSEEELREYLGELRQAPAAEIIAQVVTVLANGAQVKLGRNDARVLIDTIEAVTSTAGSVLPDDFSKQVDDLLGQLRMAQVEGEKEVARLTAEGQHEEQGDVSGDEGGATEPGQEEPGQDEPSSSRSAASRLWTPGN